MFSRKTHTIKNTPKRTTLRCESLEQRNLLAAAVLEAFFDGNNSPVPAGPSNTQIAEFDGKLYYQADDASGVDRMFVYDPIVGQAAVVTVDAPANNDNASDIWVFDDKLFATFNATVSGNTNNQVFQFNPGDNSFELRFAIPGQTSNSDPRPIPDENGDLIILDDGLLISAFSPTQLGQNATEAFILPPGNADIFQLPDFNLDSRQFQGSSPIDVTLFEGKVYYRAQVPNPTLSSTSSNNTEPYVYDPNAGPNGTVSQIIVNGRPVSGDTGMDDQFKFNGKLYAIMDSNVGDEELFEFNPTTGEYNLHSTPHGTGDLRVLRDSQGDIVIFEGSVLFDSNEEFFALNSDNTFGALRDSNGTIVDANNHPNGADPQDVTVFDGKLFYEAEVEGDASMDEPFVYDPATRMVTQITNGNRNGTRESDIAPGSMFVFDGHLFAAMDSSGGDDELFIYDPVAVQFNLVTDLHGTGSGGDPRLMKAPNGDLIVFDGGVLMDANASASTSTDEFYILRTLSPPAVELSVSANAGTESGTTAITVTATADSTVDGNQTVDLGVTGTGVTTNDYILTATTITIPDGMTTGTVTFTVEDDFLVEATETATLTISNPSSGITLGSTTSQDVMITDNDSAALTIDDVTVDEDAGTNTASLIFTVSLNQGVDIPLAVDVLFGGGSATADLDYDDTTQRVNFAPIGTGSMPVSVPIFDDNLVEMTTEDLIASLNVVTTLGGRDVTFTDQGTGTITDDDTATITVADSTINVTEGGSTPINATLSFGPGATQLAVPVTAMLPGNDDYSGSVTFGQGSGTGSSTLDVIGLDDVFLEEAVESFAGQSLAGNNGGANVSFVGSPTVEVTDADEATITLIAPDPIELTEGGETVIARAEITFNQPSTQVRFPFTVGLPGNADYTAPERTFPSGVTGGTLGLLIDAIDDSEVEPTETFADEAITGNGQSNVIYVGSRTIIVTDNDTPDPVSTGIDVQNGEDQRSFVNTVDILFTGPAGLQSLVNNNNIRVERFDITSMTAVSGTGVAVPIPGASVSGNNIQLDFGPNGIGGVNEAGNGFYRIELDLDNDGQFDDASYAFFRLFGDPNGDGAVSSADARVRQDLNNDGRYDSRDARVVRDQLGTTVDVALLAMIDD